MKKEKIQIKNGNYGGRTPPRGRGKTLLRSLRDGVLNRFLGKLGMTGGEAHLGHKLGMTVGGQVSRALADLLPR